MTFDIDIRFRQPVVLIDVRGEDECMKSVLMGSGIQLPESPYSILRWDSGAVCRVGRKWCIIMTDMINELSLIAELDRLSRGVLVQCTCVTDAYQGIELTGPDTRDVLSQITPLNLHELEDDCATFTEIFGHRGLIIRYSVGKFAVYCDRSYADYIMKRMLKCALLHREW